MDTILELTISEQGQEAWFWFIPIIIGVVVDLFFAIAIVSPVKGKSIAVLGMQGAGKTQFLANIRNQDYKDYEATLGVENYDSFKIELGERNVKIEKGKDIGGGEENIRDYYEDMIRDNDIVFFLFNAYDYLNNNTYKLKTNARLDFIYRKSENKSCVIFATFADKFKNKSGMESAYNEIKKEIYSKKYYSLFKNNFILLDMRNKSELMEILNNKIFVEQ